MSENTAPSPVEQDLELLVPVDKTVKFGRPTSRKYVVPGDMPLEPYMHVQVAMLDETNEVDGTRHLQAALEKLLLWYVDPGDVPQRAEVNKQVSRLGVRSVMKILNTIYEDVDADDPDEDAATEIKDVTPPTLAPATAQTPTTTGPSLPEESLTLPPSPVQTTDPGSD